MGSDHVRVSAIVAICTEPPAERLIPVTNVRGSSARDALVTGTSAARDLAGGMSV
jgi:hypothetical protein